MILNVSWVHLSWWSVVLLTLQTETHWLLAYLMVKEAAMRSAVWLRPHSSMWIFRVRNQIRVAIFMGMWAVCIETYQSGILRCEIPSFSVSMEDQFQTTPWFYCYSGRDCSDTESCEPGDLQQYMRRRVPLQHPNLFANEAGHIGGCSHGAPLYWRNLTVPFLDYYRNART